MERKSPVAGVFLSILPMLVAFGCQLVASLFATIGFSVYKTFQYAAQGIVPDAFGFFQAVTEDPGFMALNMVTAELVMILCGALWYYLAYRKQDNGFKTLKPVYLLFAVFAGIAIQALCSLFLTFAFSLLPEAFIESYEELTDMLFDTSSIWYVICVVVLAPIAEEHFFRGITLKLLKNHNVNIVAAVIIQGFWFGFLHWLGGLFSLGTLIQAVYAFAMGVVFGFVAAKLNSVWPTVILHMAVNGAGELLSVLSGTLEKPEIVSYGMIPVGILCLAISILLYLKVKPMEEPYGQNAI